MRHALFVAYHYPPESSSSGVLRTLKYTRYLGELGWRVTVLTLRRDAYRIVDADLEDQIPADVHVVRTRFVDLKRHVAIRGGYPACLAIPDRWIGWWPWAVAAGQRIIKEQPVDLIYSTSPYATAHLIGGFLSRRARKPWVADFRDPWYEEPPAPGTAWLAHRAARRLERLVVRRADRIVASTMRLRDGLAARYPGEPTTKFVAIPNGYDEDDFSGMEEPSTAPSDQLLFMHAGGINATFRDPRPLLAAAGWAIQAGLVDPAFLRFRFLGGGPFAASREIQQAVERAGLSAKVEFPPRVPYQEALAELRRAGVLVLLQASRDTVDLVPAKLFEYLRVGRPVLAVAPDGATAEVLRATGGGWAVDPADHKGLRDALAAVYRAWADGSLDSVTADRAVLARFSRERLASELAVQFDTVLRPRG
jgi:glycosyltransferase involved in cell wall biosynthesis